MQTKKQIVYIEKIKENRSWLSATHEKICQSDHFIDNAATIEKIIDFMSENYSVDLNRYISHGKRFDFGIGKLYNFNELDQFKIDFNEYMTKIQLPSNIEVDFGVNQDLEVSATIKIV